MPQSPVFRRVARRHAAETLYRVEQTVSSPERLEAIEAFLIKANSGATFDDRLDLLRSKVITNLTRLLPHRSAPAYG